MSFYNPHILNSTQSFNVGVVHSNTITIDLEPRVDDDYRSRSPYIQELPVVRLTRHLHVRYDMLGADCDVIISTLLLIDVDIFSVLILSCDDVNSNSVYMYIHIYMYHNMTYIEMSNTLTKHVVKSLLMKRLLVRGSLEQIA